MCCMHLYGKAPFAVLAYTMEMGTYEISNLIMSPLVLLTPLAAAVSKLAVCCTSMAAVLQLYSCGS